MPSQAEMKQYAQTLPPIYREILSAFPDVEPGRKAGYGLAFQTLAAHFANTRRGYGFEEVREACILLADGGFLEIKNGIFAHPTQLGEQLIAVVTDKPVASNARIPQLPAHAW
jgi:hypothetical protein